MNEKVNDTTIAEFGSASGVSRRRFIGYAGALAGAGMFIASCKKDNSGNTVTPTPAGAIDLGSGDIGILNYAYALEQLEAAFYKQVSMTPYSGINASEMALLNDIRDHEIAHREFFKAALGAKAIQDLEVNFTSINFTDRNSVLTTARTFEDLGVSAYNGAGKLIVNADYLVMAGKIVSVEARHAAYIRDLLNNGSFAGTTDADGLDKAMAPADVLAAASGFLKSKISGNNLPTS